MNAPMPGKTLLIVEDEILPAMALQAELQDAGYNVMDLTGRHQEALTAARECRPDLALVNIQLEGRDDGIALAGDLKGLGIPVLFISGQISRARTAQTVAIGSMPKPYSTVDMVMAVTYLLARLRGEHSPPRPPQLEVFEPAVEAAVQGSA
jgi:DNA-binding response OmpR family regulator